MSFFEQYPLLYHALIGLSVISGSAVLGRIFKSVFSFFTSAVTNRTKNSLDDRIVHVIEGKVLSLTVLFGIFIALSEMRKGVTKRDVTIVQILDYLDIIAYIGAVLLAGKVIANIIESVIEWYMVDKRQERDETITASITPMTTKLVNIGVFLMAGMVIMDHFHINIGSLLVSLGVASLAVALAAQDTIANMIAGFVILIDRPFHIGDRVLIPSGESGDVQEIGLRSTKILNLENNLLVIPNSELVKNRIINFTRPQPPVLITVEVPVSYGADIDRAKTLILEKAKEEDRLLPEPSPEVFTAAFSETGILMRLFARVHTIRLKGRVESRLREEIYKSFQENGIPMPVVQRVTKT